MRKTTKPKGPAPEPVVRHYEARRFFVQSAPGAREHLVDLDEWKGRGECGCEDYEFRVRPEYLAGSDADVPCKHIRAARQFELTLIASNPDRGPNEPDEFPDGSGFRTLSQP